jgi:catechol 2,3-dioxygenase-like lactoylglutathione lyase family enzyme
MQVRVRKMGHVGITVKDLDRSVAFYVGMLGLELTERFEYPPEEVGHGGTVAAGAFVRVDSTHHCISIFQLKDGLVDPEAAGGGEVTIGLHHLAFELATPGELLVKYREMRDGGVPIVQCRKGGPGNHPRFYARDPDGHMLEFYWGIDHIGWDGIPRAYDPITEIDLEGFDFEAFLEERQAAIDRLQAAVAAGLKA